MRDLSPVNPSSGLSVQHAAVGFSDFAAQAEANAATAVFGGEERLFVTQSNHRLYTRRAACRNRCGYECGDAKQQRSY